MGKAGRFATAEGMAVAAVTADEMRELDRVAVVGAGPTLLQMMENAGRNLAEEVLEWTAGRPGLVVVLAGSGGNGGGAICGARHLANHGVETVVVTTREEERMSPAARRQLEIHGETDGRLVAVDEVDDLEGLAPEVLVDGLIGYGLRGAPRGVAAELIEWGKRSGAKILALDGPSGVDATTGEAPGAYLRADRTLTLALPKTGLATTKAGDLVLADIGIPAGVYARAGIEYRSPFGSSYRVKLERIGRG